MNQSKLRRQIAWEAARLMYQRHESEYYRAKRKAARHISKGWIKPADLPSNAEGSVVAEPQFRLEVIVRKEGFELTNGNSVIAAVPLQDGKYDLETLSELASLHSCARRPRAGLQHGQLGRVPYFRGRYRRRVSGAGGSS